jgi:molybdopterin synthase sulfur carrier subunit
MSVTVRIPGPLRRLTDGVEKVDVEGSTLGACITELDERFPGIKDRMLDEAGEMRYFVNIYLNGEDVRFLKGLATSISSGDELSIVPAVAGGAH